MSSTQHQLIEQCATRLRGIVEALDNIHDTSPHRWSTDLDDVHSSAESLLALIKDQAPRQAAQDLALRTIAEYPCPEQDNMTAANMRQVAADAITGALAFGAQASRPPPADHWLRPFYDIGRAEGQRTQELAMLVRMLASSLKRHAPESNLVARATNYLAAKGLAGTQLRDAPASVEQVGGDERAAFEAAFAAMGRPVCRADYDQNAYGTPFDDGGWTGWQARAALAQPSPAPVSDIEFARKLFEEMALIADDEKCIRMLAGALTQPSPAQAEQAEAERLREAYEWGYGDGQNNPNGYSDKKERDACVNELLKQPFSAQAEQANSGYDQLWAWFGLSRSAYAVLPRVMMHAMPDEWQGRFAELMDEWDDHWPNQPDITAHVQIKQNNRFISTPPWLLNYRHPDHNQLNAMRRKDEL
ncbi:hypothetical protein [Pseudomonas aeruginosa]|uniref:hypothetical protein n=1 Tax=Pseudomonas aeruginosa TaxID=287 RepID=UPI00249CEE5E|nr:hypothetical protein [Pseudomonas aeruginosa]EIU1321524.1 hypothetical protein [Pseudomonas aeruginosa]WGX44975.1 hypothetical protein P7I92_12075 [Pseudomonas aeruginosa]